jgi:phage terminase small subunit
MAGPLKNTRHEKFAQALAAGETADAAYTLAGFKPNRGNATRLKLNESIFDRVQEIKGAVAEKIVEKVAIDAAWVLQKAAELHTKALEEKQLSVAKGALDIIGKHVDVQAFRENLHHSGLIEYRDLSDEEIAARIAAHENERSGRRPTAH